MHGGKHRQKCRCGINHVNSVECNLNANNIDFEDRIIRIGSEFDIAEEK
jgi:hypothetical protein